MSGLDDAVADTEARFNSSFREFRESASLPRMIMVHGGNPDRATKLPDHNGGDDAAKREQIRAGVEALPFVAEAFFSEDKLGDDPPTPGEEFLFDEADGTVILIELDPRSRGARDEVILHLGQTRSSLKMYVLIPPDVKEEIERGGLYGAALASLPSWALRYYTVDEYDQCLLVECARTWVEDINKLAARDAFDEWKRSASD